MKKMIVLILLTCFNTKASDPASSFRVAACSTDRYMKLIRGYDSGMNGAEETIVELWHHKRSKPGETFKELSALPDTGIRIAYKVRTELGTHPICHSIRRDTFIGNFDNPTDVKYKSELETIYYPHSDGPHKIEPIPTSPLTKQRFLSDINESTSIMKRELPALIAGFKKYREEFPDAE